MRAARYVAVQVRADTCNFPDVYEWRPTGPQRLVGSRWLLDSGSPPGERGLVETLQHFDMVRCHKQEFHLQMTHLNSEDGPSGSFSKCHFSKVREKM